MYKRQSTARRLNRDQVRKIRRLRRKVIPIAFNLITDAVINAHKGEYMLTSYNEIYRNHDNELDHLTFQMSLKVRTRSKITSTSAMTDRSRAA